MQPYLILGFLIVLGYLAHNLTVSYAAGLLVLLKLFLPEEKLLYFGGHGVNWGVMLLMAALMVPIATGKSVWRKPWECSRHLWAWPLWSSVPWWPYWAAGGWN